MYLALYRKWRPRTFSDVVGQEHVTQTLRRQVAAGKTSHAYLFTGTRGTGKTTCAKIIARAVNCENPVDGDPCNQCPSCLGIERGSVMDVLELDAASNNGVDQIRALRDEAIFTPASVKMRVYIVDEVHMLTTAAFNALLKILEEPPVHLMFVLATTELHKVPATIRSRCQQFAFKRISPQDIQGYLMRIAKAENIDLTQEGAALLSRLANGGMRDALSLLDQCAGEAEQLDEPTILEHLSMAGGAETARLLELIATGDTGGALAGFARLYEMGREAGSILSELSALVRDLLLCSAAPSGGAGLLTGGYESETLENLLALLEPGRLLGMLSQLQKSGADLARSPNPRTDAEICIVKLSGVSAEMPPVYAAPARPTIAPSPPADSMKTAQPVEKTAAPAQMSEVNKPDPAPLKQAAPAVSSDEMQEWSSLAGRLLTVLPSSLRGEFERGDRVFGQIEGNSLRLFVATEMLYNTIARPKNLGLIEEQASRMLGQPMRCKVEVGLPALTGHAPVFSAAEEPPAAGFDALLAITEENSDIIIAQD